MRDDFGGNWLMATLKRFRYPRPTLIARIVARCQSLFRSRAAGSYCECVLESGKACGESAGFLVTKLGVGIVLLCERHALGGVSEVRNGRVEERVRR